MQDRLFRLMERHQQLDARLHSVRAGRWPDPFEVMRLKRLKLALKDRLARALSQRSAPTSPAG